ncbi:MAG: DUF3368 domain-containing protein [Planctomycetes bacterium]|nr:DUF3368 domain-containing protein [Planctomycetota bacterium]
MADLLVVNASPIIFLAHVGGLEWMVRLSARPLILPAAVQAEVAAGPGGEELLRSLRGLSEVQIRPDLPVPETIAAWDLGRGESQVLAVCRESSGRTAVLDDLAARRCAQALQISVLGTLGIVVAARRRGWLPAARPVLNRLLAVGMYVTPALVDAMLADIGE